MRRSSIRTSAISGLLVCAMAVASGSAAGAGAPDTTITGGPKGPWASTTAAFRFTASVTGSTFGCQLDNGPWRTCTSPRTYESLAQGSHTFRVRARKGILVDATPSLRTFRVDTIAPDTTITDGPASVITTSPASFAFTSTEKGTFQCSMDGRPFLACVSPFVTAAPLTDDWHVFRVRASDAAGNKDLKPAKRRFGYAPPLQVDLPTAALAVTRVFPPSKDFDWPAMCGGSQPIDCPGGVATAATPQVSITSSDVSLVERAGQNRFDVSATLRMKTIANVAIELLGAKCILAFDSAAGTSSTWAGTIQLSFARLTTADGDIRYIAGSDLQVTGVQSADFTLTGDLLCTIGALLNEGHVADIIENLLLTVGLPLCPAPGPAVLASCADLGVTEVVSARR